MTKEQIYKKLRELAPQISQKVDVIRSSNIKFTLKNDGSELSELDTFISNLIKNAFAHLKLNFYSEEDHGELALPAIILDPLDGTREFVQNRSDCSVSFGIYFSLDLMTKETSHGFIIQLQRKNFVVLKYFHYH